MLGKGKQVMWRGRKLGYLTSDLIFVTHRKQKHLFRMHKGWGMAEELLKELLDVKCGEIRLIESRDNGDERIYITTPEKWMNGIPYDNRKFEPQRILPIKNFTKIIGE